MIRILLSLFMPKTWTLMSFMILWPTPPIAQRPDALRGAVGSSFRTPINDDDIIISGEHYFTHYAEKLDVCVRAPHEYIDNKKVFAQELMMTIAAAYVYLRSDYVVRLFSLLVANRMSS
jgi:hypothetical protein